MVYNASMAKQLTAPGCKYSIVARVDTTIYSPDQKWVLDVPAGQTDFIAETNEIIIPADAMMCRKKGQIDADLARFNVLGRGAGSLATFVTRAIEQIVGKGNAKVEYGDGKLAVSLASSVTAAQMTAVENLLDRLLPKDVVADIDLFLFGFARVDYLETTGNAIKNLQSYIMLPVDINLQTDSFAFETEHEFVLQYNENQAEGSNIHQPMMFYGMRTNGIAYYGFGYADQSVVDGTAVTPGYNVFRAEYDKGTVRFLRNSFLEAQIQKSIPQSKTIVRMLGVFGTTGYPITGEQPTGSAYPFNGRKKYFKVWVNDELKRHLIPALDQAGVPCMFDLVSKTPFYNQGTGAFVAGFDTVEQIRKLATLPDVTAETDETKKSLTVSMPLELAFDASVKSALDVAAARGWTIIVQHRESEIATANLEADFLESTGTQYINTGIIPQNERLKGKFSIIDKNQYNYVAYTQILTSKDIYLHRPSIIGYSPYSESGLLSVDLARVLVDFEPGKVYSAEVDFQKAVVDGQTLKEFNVPLYENYVPVCLFAYSEGIEGHGLTKLSHPTKIKLYKFELYDDGEKELDMLPCLDLTGTPCMYDTVTDQNFYNQGTGQFTIGFDTTEKAAISLSKLPVTTNGTLTVSLPAESKDTATLVPAAIDIAKSRGWTIIEQIRTN